MEEFLAVTIKERALPPNFQRLELESFGFPPDFANDQSYDRDARFWNGMQAGLNALTHHDYWIATLQLCAMIRWFRRFDELDDPTREQLDAISLPPLSPLFDLSIADEIRAAFQRLISFYCDLRDKTHIPCSPWSELEDQTLTTLDVLLRQERHFDEVLTWRTCSIILPAFNEEAVIAETIYACLRAVRRFCPNCEIVVVDDGSRDHTGQIIDAYSLHDASVVAVHNRPNKGYGGALLAGFSAARGEWLFFMDSDGQFDIRDIAKLLVAAESHPESIVLGYRAQRSDPFMRNLNAWGWKQATKWLIGLKQIRDIDCAFKLFPAKTFRATQVIARGASVNAEFLTKFQRMQIPIIQIAVQHLPRTKGSPTGAKLSVILRAFRELFRLRHHLKTWKPEFEEAKQ